MYYLGHSIPRINSHQNFPQIATWERNFKIVIFPFRLRQGMYKPIPNENHSLEKAQQYSTTDQHHKSNRIQIETIVNIVCNNGKSITCK